MHTIYANAASVYCWLGGGDVYSDWLFSTCNEESGLYQLDHARERVAKAPDVSDEVAFDPWKQSHRTVPQDPIRTMEEAVLVASTKVVKRNYFTRMWVLQEFVLAKRVTLLWVP